MLKHAPYWILMRHTVMNRVYKVYATDFSASAFGIDIGDRDIDKPDLFQISATVSVAEERQIAD